MSLIALLAESRPLMMGILNVTPDSFSDGGEHCTEDSAVEHGLMMLDEGADIIDIGGESTRPGAERVTAREQLDRVVNVIGRIKQQSGGRAVISIDTTLEEVAGAALDAGAEMINDISAGRESQTFALAAEREVPLAIMHMQGTPATMQIEPSYDDVVSEVLDFLLERAAVAESAGVHRERILIDPGIGFGKSKRHNLELIANIARFVDSGYRVILGASRKRFMGSICAETEYRRLVGATCATTAVGVLAGVQLFRVHDVRVNRQAAEVVSALKRCKQPVT